MKKISFLLVACATIMFAACDGKQSKSSEEQTVVETEEVVDMASSELAIDYIGVYEGTLPCADCEGIQTLLTIREDKTYDLVSEYLGKQDSKFEESGVYNIINGEVIELVTPSSGEKTYYKILESSVALVADSTGVLNEGELAKYYILAKKAE